MKRLSDDKLMSLIAEGEMAALEELFGRHSGMIFGYACRLVGQKERAEDVSQTVWIKLVKAAPSYEGRGQLKAWLKTMTRNTCLNDIRKNSRIELSESMEENAEVQSESQLRQNLEEDLLVKHDTKLVLEQIERLPDSQRVALVTWLNEDLSYEELARELGFSLSAVKSLLFRAKKTLQEELKEAS